MYGRVFDRPPGLDDDVGTLCHCALRRMFLEQDELDHVVRFPNFPAEWVCRLYQYRQERFAEVQRLLQGCHDVLLQHHLEVPDAEKYCPTL